MVNFKNFKVYVPNNIPDDLAAINVTFLISDEGEDWYECQSKFSKETLKVSYDPQTKVIRSSSYDVSSLFPVNLSVGEVKSAPKRFVVGTPSNEFIYNEEKQIIATRVYSEEETIAKVENKKANLIAETMLLINPLQFAKDLEIITEEEATRLRALQKYVVLLNRVPQQETYPTGVVWPEIPTT